MSDKKTIQEILGTKAESISNTYFDNFAPSVQRQVVISALLELYKAEALSGSGKSSVSNSMYCLEENASRLLTALRKGE